MEQLKTRLQSFLSKNSVSTDWMALRAVRETSTYRVVRNEHPEANQVNVDEGVMIEILQDGQIGYAATSDVTDEGLKRALAIAKTSTKAAASKSLFPFSTTVRPASKGHYCSPMVNPVNALALGEMTEMLLEGSRQMNVAPEIVARRAHAMIIESEFEYLSSNGADTSQSFSIVDLNLAATAQQGSEMQTRSFVGSSRQIGAEAFDRARLSEGGRRTGHEAMELLRAENCPTERMDMIAMPQQMMLQIHESIGHPLELDRILGDERNYAGFSFVRPEDFGKLQYGSKLLNVTFDPSVVGEFASYGFDDGGAPAKREYLIKDGVLLRGLGGLESQARLKLSGVANFRASSWNRAPIDRMANINLEAGTAKLEDMIAQVQRGILVDSNRSWSIDDYRNKFQFGCEYAQLIENGKVTRVLKNANYRGTTVDFWSRLKAVGNRGEDFGTPYCGKGEPNQVIRVGHSSPPCLFSQLEVFGGQA